MSHQEWRRGTGYGCTSCSSGVIRTGRWCRRGRKITAARSSIGGTGCIWPGSSAVDQTMCTNEQGENDLWVSSKADIQVGLQAIFHCDDVTVLDGQNQIPGNLEPAVHRRLCSGRQAVFRHTSDGAAFVIRVALGAVNHVTD